jgi:hypothetical protein
MPGAKAAAARHGELQATRPVGAPVGGARVALAFLAVLLELQAIQAGVLLVGGETAWRPSPATFHQ